MKILFISNYYTHHQQPLCEALDRLTEHQFTFVELETFPEERKSLGWQRQTSVPFVKQYEELLRSENNEIMTADVVIIGSAPLSIIRNRLKAHKLVFLYAERIFKSGYQPLKWLPRLYRFWLRYGRHRSMYLLAASAYTTGDYVRHGAFCGKSYRWGYFPEAKKYDIHELHAGRNPLKMLWCGRLLDWKHPEAALSVAKRLKEDGYSFEMEFIGNGPLKAELKLQAQENGLSDCVRFLGSMSTSEVRAYMEATGIYLFTSDFKEGWGAVLNEAMNSGCAVVASHAIGAVPFLLRHGENGLIYHNGNTDELYEHVKFLLDQPERQRQLGIKAYQTIDEVWNANNAAERFLKLVEQIQRGGHCRLYEAGPCSKATVVWNNWYKG